MLRSFSASPSVIGCASTGSTETETLGFPNVFSVVGMALRAFVVCQFSRACSFGADERHSPASDVLRVSNRLQVVRIKASSMKAFRADLVAVLRLVAGMIQIKAIRNWTDELFVGSAMHGNLFSGIIADAGVTVAVDGSCPEPAPRLDNSTALEKAVTKRYEFAAILSGRHSISNQVDCSGSRSASNAVVARSYFSAGSF